MPKPIETDVKVGLFIVLGVGLIMLAIFSLGETQSFFSGKNRYVSHFARVDGLITGAKVILAGVPVGTVEKIHFEKGKRDIEVEFSVGKDSLEWIRKDSTVEISTQGVLGDKYLSINPGNDGQPLLENNAEIPEHPSKDFSHFLSKGDQLLVSISSIATSVDRILKNFENDNRSELFFKNLTASVKSFSAISAKMEQEFDQVQLKSALNHINHIMEKFDNGTGTIGALINDSSLYDEVKALMGGANRNRIIRNLVRQTIKDSATTSPAPSPKP